MSTQAYLAALLRHWVAIVVFVVLGTSAAFLYAQTIPPTYRSLTSVIVVPERGTSSSELVQGSTYVQSLVQSYSALAQSPLVLQPVIDDLALSSTPQQLARRMTVQPQVDTVIIDIAVIDESPQQAQAIAAGVGEELASAVPDVSPTGEDGQAAVRMSTIAPATLPAVAVGPRRNLMLAAGAAIGGALGVGWALFRFIRSQRMITRDTALDELGIPVLGEVATFPRYEDIATMMMDQPDGSTAESFRALAANLAVTSSHGTPRAVLVTSASPGEGKSSVSVGLASLLAETGRKVLLIDADLRLPTIARLTQLEGAVGLTTVTLGDIPLDEATQPWGLHDLDVLTSGAVQSNPGHLLSSGRLRRVLEQAKEQYDHVVVDTAPVLDVSDAVWLAPLVDGVLLVTRDGRSRRKDLAAAVDKVSQTSTPVLGLVLNGVRRGSRSPYDRFDEHGAGKLRKQHGRHADTKG